MKIGVPKESARGETLVALIPAIVPSLTREQHTVIVETGAGLAASHADDEYRMVGAAIIQDAAALYAQAEVVFKVRSPDLHEANMLKERAVCLGFFVPLAHLQTVDLFIRRRITSFSMEYIPRIARAQHMDALSSMATVAGYKAAIIAAERLAKMFPLLMTAAGTIPPAIVLVLGAGVAGLQAIATARRLGAKVEAFDPRPDVKEQVKSLGATFIDMEIDEVVEITGGYAQEQSEQFLGRERDVIAARLPSADAVICTAQVFGRQAPVLLTSEMLMRLRPGTVIVDLAADRGGNCAWTVPGETVVKHGVTVVGAVNLPATVPTHASQLYAKNLASLFLHLYPGGVSTPDFADEITRSCCITHDGRVVHDTVRAALEQKGASTA